MSILVVGDAMIDKHTKGAVERISPEAPVPVVNAGPDSSYALGAAANVAAQVAASDIKCFFACRAFESDPDGSHERLFSMCGDARIQPIPLIYPGVRFPVTTKERIWAEGQQLCRVDREHIERPVGHLADKWIAQLKALITKERVKVVIFSDYDKGTLTDQIIQSVADFCAHENVITILDPKRYSYWGLQHLTLIKPNNREIAITHMEADEVSRELEDTLLLNTLGKDGMKLWQNGKHIHSESIFTQPGQVVDVCGCGDTVSAFLGIGYYKNLGIEQSIKVASLAAAVNTRYVGCHVLDKSEIESVLG